MNLRGFTCAAALAVFALAAGCQQEVKESPTKGTVEIPVAESVAPLLQQERQTFQELYPDAHVDLKVTSSRQALAWLFYDSAKMIISARALNREEREAARQARLNLTEYRIAIDAVGMIVNAANPVAELRTTQLDSVLDGTVKSWSGVGGKRTPIELCLPSRNSANYETVAMKVLHGKSIASPAALVHTSQEMLAFVAHHPNAIGMVGMNWLGEKNDTVRALKLCDPQAPDSLDIKGQYFAPLQAHVYRGFYPLTRDVMIYLRTDRYDVTAGFTSFLTSATGQKIVLSSGLVPATMPVRLVELTNKGI